MKGIEVSTALDRYEAVLWWTMDVLGVTDSIERKVVAAVGIQFGATVGVFVLPLVLSGPLGYLLSGAVFLGAAVAMVNTLLIVRRDVTGPVLETASRQADALARQEFDDPALEEEVPGAFGDSLDEMAGNLAEYTAELETMTERLEERSRRLEGLVAAFSEAAQRAREVAVAPRQ